MPITVISLGFGFLNFKVLHPFYELLSFDVWFFFLYTPLLTAYVIFVPLTIMYSRSFDNASREDVDKSFREVKESFIDKVFPIA